MTSLLTNIQPIWVDYAIIVNDTLVSYPRQDPRFLYLATHKVNFNTQSFQLRRCKEFHHLDATNCQFIFEITDGFHN